MFANVGRIDHGDLSYRAYFFADLFAHMSVVGELEKQTIPTVNPYLSTEALPYYWTYFTFPTVFSMLQPALHVDRGLLLMAFTGAGALHDGVVSGRPRPGRIAAGRRAPPGRTVIAATSYEGIALLGYLWRRGAPFSQIRDYNVDALTRWWWEAPSADGLHRLFWYTPQHGTAITAGLLAVATYVLARDANGIRRGAVRRPAARRRADVQQLQRRHAGAVVRRRRDHRADPEPWPRPGPLGRRARAWPRSWSSPASGCWSGSA